MARGKPDVKGYGQWWWALLTKPAVMVTIAVIAAICINPDPKAVFWNLVRIGLAYFLIKPIYRYLIKPYLFPTEEEAGKTK